MGEAAAEEEGLLLVQRRQHLNLRGCFQGHPFDRREPLVRPHQQAPPLQQLRLRRPLPLLQLEQELFLEVPLHRLQLQLQEPQGSMVETRGLFLCQGVGE